MKITVLFDLDDTLISNDTDSFLKVYLKELSRFISGIAPQKFVSDLLAATGKMVANQSPTSTLEEVFDQAFYPAIGQSKEDLSEKLNHFYEQIFPTFVYLTQTRPEAVSLVEAVLQKGHKVVIATSPLFPKTAILHRLTWAGLPADRYPFEIITAYEDFHFAKPNPAYFAEIIGRLGCAPNPVVMIGNSWEDDILPAEKFGLPTFWLSSTNPVNLAAQRHPLSRNGQLADIPAWLDIIAGQSVELPAPQPEALLTALVATPAVFDFYKRKLIDQNWHAHNFPEITRCLRDTEAEVHLPRLQQLILEENAHFNNIELRKRGEIQNDGSKNWQFNLEQFIADRLTILQQLRSLPDGCWRHDDHPAKTDSKALTSLVQTIVKHDQEHLSQVHQYYKTINQKAV